jgi:hypothetical protein
MKNWKSWIIMMATLVVVSFMSARAQADDANASTAQAAQQSVLGDKAQNVILRADLTACLKDCGDQGAKCPSAADLNVCRENVASCKKLNAEWEAAYALLAGVCGYETRTEPGPPIKKVRRSSGGGSHAIVEPPRKTLICEEGSVVDGRGCKCTDPEAKPMQLVDNRGHAPIVYVVCGTPIEVLRKHIAEENDLFNALCVNEKGAHPALGDPALSSQCTATGQHIDEVYKWYLSLLDGQFPLNGTNWAWIYNSVTYLQGQLTDIQNALKALCPPIQAKPNATLAERCHAAMAIQRATDNDQYKEIGGLKARVRVLEDKPNGGLLGGGNEVGVTVNAFAAVRPGEKNTYGFYLSPYMVAWSKANVGLVLGGIVGYGNHESADRMVLGGKILAIFAANEARTVNPYIGGFLTAEPGLKGNEATNLGPMVGIQFHLGGPWVADIGALIGGSKIVSYSNGVRGKLSDIGFEVQPFVGIGLAAF